MILTGEMHLRLGYSVKKVMPEGTMTPLNVKSLAWDYLRGALGHVALRLTSLLILTKNLLNCNAYWFRGVKDLCFTVCCLYPQDLEKIIHSS